MISHTSHQTLAMPTDPSCSPHSALSWISSVCCHFARGINIYTVEQPLGNLNVCTKLLFHLPVTMTVFPYSLAVPVKVFLWTKILWKIKYATNKETTIPRKRIIFAAVRLRLWIWMDLQIWSHTRFKHYLILWNVCVM